MENQKSTKITSNNQTKNKDESTINTTSNNNITDTQKESKNKKEKKKEKSPQKDEIKQEPLKKEEDDEIAVPLRSIKRSNSIKLYKKHKKDKDKKNSSKKENEIDAKEKVGNIFDILECKKRRVNKNTKNKKVTFPKDFVIIIDVESYKKFNEENTCKDPFENMEIVNGRLVNTNNTKNDEPNGKANVLCSCVFF